MLFEAVSIVLAERMDSSVATAGARSVLIAWVLDRLPIRRWSPRCSA